VSATIPAAGEAARERPLLKMSELAERSGVSAGTIRYYLREGLLGAGEDIVRTSRNMAYYPPEYVERIELIKRLQEKRFMPLRVIKSTLAENPGRVHALIELEDRILERALASAESSKRVSVKAVHERYEIPRNVLERLAEIGVLTPNRNGYDQDDVKIIEAIASFRAGGYEEALGFTVYDTLRYREALEPLVAEEVQALLARLAGEVEVERAMEIVAAGVEPLRELLGAMHSKLLLAELRRLHVGYDARPARIEVVPTRNHMEARWVADRAMIARGWERQLDIARNGIFYEHRSTLDAARYRAWLSQNAISYVALPDAPLDYSARGEARVIGIAPGYLREVWRSTHWRLFAVRGATPLAQPPSVVTQLDSDSFTLRASRAGATVVRLRFTPYWSIADGRGCVQRARGGWTEVRTPSAESVHLAIAFSLARVFGDSPHCR